MSRRRIVIDASCLLKPLTGVGVYTNRLITALLGRASNIDYVLWANSLKGRIDISQFPSGTWSCIRTRCPGKLLLNLWAHTKWPKLESFTGSCHLFHSPNFYYHHVNQAKTVATVHDLFFLRHPEMTERFGGQYFSRIVPKRIPEVDAIIAVSQSTARDLEDLLNVPPAKIRVIHEAVDPAFSRTASMEDELQVLSSFGIHAPFILTVGTIEPRKNLPFLVRVLAKWHERSSLKIKLVIVGGAGWGMNELRNEIARWNAESWVHLTSYLDQKSLAVLYRRCLLFAFPSIYEGFGLPLLEAMTCGAPIIASNNSSIPEIVHSAALLVETDCEDAWIEGIQRLIHDSALTQQLIQTGYSQVRMFSWEKTASETEDVYKDIL